jgi:hypothetical protein
MYLAVQAEMIDDPMEAIATTNVNSNPNPNPLILHVAGPTTLIPPAAEVTTAVTAASAGNTGTVDTEAETTPINLDAPITQAGPASTTDILTPDIAITILDITEGTTTTSTTAVADAAPASTDAIADAADINSIATNANSAAAQELNGLVRLQVAASDISCPICKDIFSSAYVSVYFWTNIFLYH